MPARRRTFGASVSRTSANLPKLSVVYQNVKPRVSLDFVRRAYHEYRGLHNGLNKAGGEASADDISLKTFLQPDLIWDHAAGTQDVMEEALLSVQ